MVVAGAGKPRLASFIIGLISVASAFGLVLYTYSYTLGLTSNEYGYTILESKVVPELFLFIGVIVLFGVYGGIEIGRFIEANKKRTFLHEKH